MGLISDLEQVLEKLDMALGEKDANEELFMSAVDEYLLCLENWQKSYSDTIKSEEVREREGFFELGTRLKEGHKQLMEETIMLKEEVGEELASINSRAKAIRKYIDILPNRVSMTRGKKG